MDKYLYKWIVSDFILGDASYFQVGKFTRGFRMPSISEADIDSLHAGGQITEGGRIYGHLTGVSTQVSETWLREKYSMWGMPQEEIELMLENSETDASGNVTDNAHLYGMEDYPLSQLNVIEGDLADLYHKDKRMIAAVYDADDYGQPMDKSNFAKVGDKVTLHYVYEMEFLDMETGDPVTIEEIENGYDRGVAMNEVRAEDITYEVAACVTIKHAMSYRYAGSAAFVLNAQVFQRDSQTSDIMTYLFNTTPETNETMQAYLEHYTNKGNPNLDFESKQAYVHNFERFRSTFLLMGGSLSFVVGLVGVLNFFNAVLTSIHSRRREFAMLQSIGMTGEQLKRMLICEGLVYAAAAVFVSLVCSFLMVPAFHGVLGSIFWFFTYRFTILPVLLVIPIFSLFGVLLPLISYRRAVKMTIVERLREGE